MTTLSKIQKINTVSLKAHKAICVYELELATDNLIMSKSFTTVDSIIHRLLFTVEKMKLLAERMKANSP